MGSQVMNPIPSNTSFNMNDAELYDDEIYYLLRKTNFSREQIQEFYSNFLRDCPHGYITKKNFLRICQASYQNDNKSEKFCEYVFKAIDVNSKNYIEFSDFIFYFYIVSFGTQKEKIELAFKIFDLKKDNVIEKNEFRKVLKALHESTCDQKDKNMDTLNFDQQIDDVINRLDKNDNGIIEFDEFLKGCLEDLFIEELLVNQMFN